MFFVRRSQERSRGGKQRSLQTYPSLSRNPFQQNIKNRSNGAPFSRIRNPTKCRGNSKRLWNKSLPFFSHPWSLCRKTHHSQCTGNQFSAGKNDAILPPHRSTRRVAISYFAIPHCCRGLCQHAFHREEYRFQSAINGAPLLEHHLHTRRISLVVE